MNPQETVLLQCAPIGVSAYFRVEFNPSLFSIATARTFIDFVLPGGYDFLVNNGKCTRLDLTVDVNHVDVNELLVIHPGSRKTSAFHDSGRVSTLYIGTKQSPKRYCVYDKRKEILYKNRGKIAKNTIPNCNQTRIEARVCTGFWMRDLLSLENPFEKLVITQLVTDHSPWFPVFAEACRSVGAQQALLMIGDKGWRHKYRELLKKSSQSWWHPEVVFADWQGLAADLLKPGPAPYDLACQFDTTDFASEKEANYAHYV